MADEQSSIGGELTLGTETPKKDVIKGWNFKVEGADDEGAQSLELAGLVPFVQLIGLYDQAEIDRLLGRENNAFERTVEFVNEDEALNISEAENIDNYKRNTEEDVRSFEDQIKKNYIKVFLVNENMTEGEGVSKNGIILATNSPQVGNEAYEVIDDISTPKDSACSPIQRHKLARLII